MKKRTTAKTPSAPADKIAPDRDYFWDSRANIGARINRAQDRLVKGASGDIRKFRRAKAELARARFDFDSLMVEWALAHPFIRIGFCPVCDHAGEDCTGKR